MTIDTVSRHTARVQDSFPGTSISPSEQITNPAVRMYSTLLRCLLVLLSLTSMIRVDAQMHTTVPVHALPPDFNQITRRAGMIFAGTVLKIEPVRAPSSIKWRALRSRSGWSKGCGEHGVDKRFTSASGLVCGRQGARYRVGQRLMLFLYPPSTLGLRREPQVGGRSGEFAVDRDGRIVLVRDSRRRSACPLSPSTSTSTGNVPYTGLIQWMVRRMRED